MRNNKGIRVLMICVYLALVMTGCMGRSTRIKGNIDRTYGTGI